jgi:hypothetical protein
VFDKDPLKITRLYREARDKNLSVLPLVVDFTDPTPSRGLSSHVSIAAADRIQCDLVVAIGLINPLIVKRHLRFDQVVSGLAQFCRRWLIVDFDETTAPQSSSGFRSEDLSQSLLKRFRVATRLETHSPNHNVLLCEK